MTIENEASVRDILLRIESHLSLLTHEIRTQAMKAFEADFLKSVSQVKMFRAMDDSKQAQQIAAAAEVGPRAAQLLIKDLHEAGFVDIRTDGKAQIPRINREMIHKWYLEKSVV